ncbi:hypothetical protein CHS0354_022830 [Potamilus streckersoni]|uniref:P/Homo B domain-containing protein n=1 Tax=Potamilus streckersoni TaxID=2493646 RepID=A0AAE0S2A5_9BIVA|nr:hypothetical protein CHS0354_022830 [Potamilus streckersoni]
MIRYSLFLGVISSLTFFYIYCDDQIHHYTNQFIVWCEDKSSDNIIAEWTLSEKFTIEKVNIPGQDCLYLVTDTSKPKGTRSIEQDTNTVETLMAQRKVNNVEQQEYKVRVTKTADTQWLKLWYLNRAITPSMKVQEAWNLGYDGSGITIAVVDDGVETTHTDLNANMYSGYHYDFVDNDTDPDPRDGKNHGTQCSGIIVAEANNNECIVGVAYGAKVIGVRLLSVKGTTDLKESQSLSHQRSVVDIYTNSWGPPDGKGYYDTGSLVKAALLSGVTTGRSGKGAIFTWTAGNGYRDDNCNADGYVNSIYTIGVTSLDSTGVPASYSEICAAAMATTYGGSYPSSYFSKFKLEGCSTPNCSYIQELYTVRLRLRLAVQRCEEIRGVDAAGITDSITIDGNCTIQYLEHVQVQIHFQALSIGHVELTLTSPNGTKSNLMTQRSADYRIFGTQNWTFMTLQPWGEAPEGQWNLTMAVKLQTDIDVCSGNPCAVLGLACAGNNYEFECTDPLPTTNDTTSSTVSSSTTAAIAGGVAAGAVVFGIAVAIVATVVRLKLARAATIAPVTI